MSELRPTPFAEVNSLLDYFRMQTSAVLGSHFRGMYVVGSLALGDFDPQHSDLDLVIVTDSDLDEALYTGLQWLHEEFSASHANWGTRVEAVYVPQDALNLPFPEARLIPQIERGTTLFKAPLENGWVFQCHSLREHGLVIAGDDPKTFMKPIKPNDMRPAVAIIAGTWAEQARNDPEWLEWVRERQWQIFVIQTLCRMLYSLATGGVASKLAAVAWAQSHLDKRWSKLLASVQVPLQEDTLPDTIALIRYTFEQAQ